MQDGKETLSWELAIQAASQDPTLRTLTESPVDAFSVLQLRYGLETSGWHYKTWAYLKRRNMFPSINNYEIIYTAPLPPFRDPTDALDAIYEQFHETVPDNFLGHTIVISDILVLKMDNYLSAHYVDKFGFADLLGFLPDSRSEVGKTTD